MCSELTVKRENLSCMRVIDGFNPLVKGVWLAHEGRK